MSTDWEVGQKVFLPGENLHGVIGSIERKITLNIRTDDGKSISRWEYYAVPESPTRKLSTYIFCNSDPESQVACTKTALAVDELIADVPKERVISVQTQVAPIVFELGYVLILCTATVLIEEEKEKTQNGH